MPTWLEVPGRLYVVATLLPLAGFALLLVAGAVRNLCRPFRQVGGFGSSVYWLLGGDRPLKTGAYFVTGCMAVAATLGVLGAALFGLLVAVAAGIPTAAPADENAQPTGTGSLGLAFLGVADASPKAPLTGTPEEKPPPRTAVAYLLPFEIVSVHLLVVLVGAAYLARAKRRVKP